jgi:penicillin-binding protein 2
VQLPGEASGRIPSPEVKKALFDANPGAFLTGSYVIGDNINAAIGQGDVLLTPLQLANVYSAIANGGKIYSPNVALRVYKPGTADTLEPIVVQEYAPRLLKEMTFPDGYLDQTRKGLRDVVATEEGTAFRVFQGYEGMTVAGKTGTAQDFTKRSERDTSLFAAYGPFEDPRYTVVAVLERSGFGSESATPVVRRVFEGLSDPSIIPVPEPAPFLDPAADFTQLPIESDGPDGPLPGSPSIVRSGSRD